MDLTEEIKRKAAGVGRYRLEHPFLDVVIEPKQCGDEFDETIAFERARLASSIMKAVWFAINEFDKGRYLSMKDLEELKLD